VSPLLTFQIHKARRAEAKQQFLDEERARQQRVLLLLQRPHSSPSTTPANTPAAQPAASSASSASASVSAAAHAPHRGRGRSKLARAAGSGGVDAGGGAAASQSSGDGAAAVPQSSGGTVGGAANHTSLLLQHLNELGEAVQSQQANFVKHYKQQALVRKALSELNAQHLLHVKELRARVRYKMLTRKALQKEEEAARKVQRARLNAGELHTQPYVCLSRMACCV